jgi:hypothetical protein
MSITMETNRTIDIANNISKSDSSSDNSEPSNKDRLRTFKALSTKGNSVMQHLMHYREPKA